MNNRALIAMSGGVDSAIAALLMQQNGFHCKGLTMRLTGQDGAGDALAVCHNLGMEHEVLDCRNDFNRQVIDRFVNTYLSGRTPNPCIDCNRLIKFGLLLDVARQQGFDTLVTGHYARLQINENTGRVEIRKALDPGKDQSYVLYSLTQNQLAHIAFPLGQLTKQQVREMARRQGLPVADRGESQDICFVPDGNYASFLEAYTGQPLTGGNFIDEKGAVVGQHRGIARYTLGQHRRLGLSAGHRVYVTNINSVGNEVQVGPPEGLYHSALEANGLSWISGNPPEDDARITAKTRYRSEQQPCTITLCGQDRMQVLFERPQRALTPGQAVVLYNGDTMLGGGTIDRVLER